MLAETWPAAERALRRAVTRLPVSPDAFLRLATVTERQGRPLEARDACAIRRARRRSRADDTMATRIADCRLRIGEPLLAVWYDRAIDERGPTPALLERRLEPVFLDSFLIPSPCCVPLPSAFAALCLGLSP